MYIMHRNERVGLGRACFFFFVKKKKKKKKKDFEKKGRGEESAVTSLRYRDKLWLHIRLFMRAVPRTMCGMDSVFDVYLSVYV